MRPHSCQCRGAAELPHPPSHVPPWEQESSGSDSQTPRHQASIYQLLYWAPGETSTPRGHPPASVTYSWVHSPIGLLPMPEPGTLVSLGHGKPWALGPSKETSVNSSLRHCPHGQTIFLFSLAPQRSGLAGDRERTELGRGSGPPGDLCCWELPRSRL